MLFVKNLMVAFLAALSLCSLAFAQEATNEERVWLTYKEEIITAKTPFKAGFFSSEKEVEVYGVLWTPRLKKGEQPKKLPLFVMNHGSQGPTVKNIVNVRADGATITLIENGFAVFAPVRKGFRRAGDPPTDISVDSSEPIACNSWPAQEAGLKSAKDDVKALLAQLKGRQDVDTNRIVLAGHSRGGFLSLALAAEQLQGLLGVINLVGAWHSEPCPSGPSYNNGKLAQFAKEANVPIFSYYGTKDTFYPEEVARGFVQILSQNKKAVSEMTSGYNHYSHQRDYEPWVAVATKLIKAE
jgi:dienelactone hydrolase